MKRNIYELMEIEKKKGKLTMKEKKRLKIFHKIAKTLDVLWIGKCKGCDAQIHRDVEFCSSECYRTHHKLLTRLEEWRTKHGLSKARKDVKKQK